MKTDRLLSVVICLLNHDVVSASKLAEKFDVSRRTIMRDIEQISLAGIPIKSVSGANGGYSIMEGYKLDGRLVSAGDRSSIVTALEGFLSAYDGGRYGDILEKISSIAPKERRRHIFYDFGAAGENGDIQKKLQALEKAALEKKSVRISYVNALGGVSDRLIEPVALNYRWYAWYLLAYCTAKQDYRIFKLARISGLEPAGTVFTKEHGDPALLLERAFQGRGRKEVEVSLLCKAEVKVLAREYLGGTVDEITDDGGMILRMRVLEDERMWFAMLLSFGDKVTVLEPEELKTRLAETAENILSVYRKQ